MVAYAIILFVVAAVLLIWGSLLYKGNLKSMRADHQRIIKDKASYGKAMGKALFIMSISEVLAGVLALFGENTLFAIISVIVSFFGLILGVFCINKVEEKLINCEF